jgi:hypothetical protein
MQRSTITLPTALLDELLAEVKAKSKTDAVIRAIRDGIRVRKLARIKSMAGRMEFVKTADDLRHGDKRLG